MGIQGLTKLIAEHAPNAIKRCEIKSYSGNKIAIDASVSMYQFMIAVRQPDGQLLVNDRGEITSHLAGMFYRTLRMMHCGIKPVYVFDGNSPSLKSEQVNNMIDLISLYLFPSIAGQKESSERDGSDKSC